MNLRNEHKIKKKRQKKEYIPNFLIYVCIITQQTHQR